jgi:glycosyltransferase involved in cell wall biosynthesis
VACPVPVSVVVPCFNGAAFLGEALSSVLGQTLPPREILVVDDASTDASAATAEAFGPPVRVIRLPENRGESHARNRGIEEASGEWLGFLDADDLWLPRKLEAQLASAAADTLAVCSNIRVFGDDQREVVVQVPEGRLDPGQVMRWHPIHMCSVLVRRSSCPRFDERVRLGEDVVFALELARRGRIAHVPGEPLAAYRRHRGGQTGRQPDVQQQILDATLQWAHESNLSEAEWACFHDGWAHRLAWFCAQHKRERNFDAYWATRRLLARYSGHPLAREVLRERIWPKWLYGVRDLLRRRARFSSR